MRIIFIIISLILIYIPVFAGISPEKLEQAKNLLEQSDLSRGNVKGLQWDIKLETDNNGRHQENLLIVKVRGTNSLAVYRSPSKVKGRKLLMKERNMWFIKPGLSKPIPISPRQKLLGGASNGDIASTNYTGDYMISGLHEGKFNNINCFIYDLKAKNKKVTYDRIMYWVSKKRGIGLKAQFYTISGKMFKSAEFEYDHQINIDGTLRPFVSKMTITKAMIKTDRTVMVYDNIKIKPIRASEFNLNLLAK